jgi:hypothetical protein
MFVTGWPPTLPPLPGVFPDYFAPIVRNGVEGRELVMALGHTVAV